MAERPVLVGVIPQTVVLDDGDQVSWISDAGNLRVEFDVNRCPFSSNVFQAPAGMRLLSGPPRPGSKAATYKYRLWLNAQLVGQREVMLRGKKIASKEVAGSPQSAPLARLRDSPSFWQSPDHRCASLPEATAEALF